jgi:hypothetical protein
VKDSGKKRGAVSTGAVSVLSENSFEVLSREIFDLLQKLSSSDLRYFDLRRINNP